MKLVELAGTRQKPELSRYTIEPLPRDSVTDGNIANVEAVGAAIERALRKLGYTSEEMLGRSRLDTVDHKGCCRGTSDQYGDHQAHYAAGDRAGRRS